MRCHQIQKSKIPKCTLSKDCLDGLSIYLIFTGQTIPYMVKAVNFPQYEDEDQKQPGVTAGYGCLGMVMFEYDLAFNALHASTPEFLARSSVHIL